MRFSSSLRALPILASLAVAAGCAGTGGFDFDDGMGGELENKVYAVNSAVDVIVWGPSGMDMNATVLRGVTGSDASVVVTTPRSYFEQECVVGEVEIVADGDGRVGIADRLSGAPLAWADIRTAPVARVDVRRTVGWGGVELDRLGDNLTLVEGGTTTLNMVPVAADGEALAGRLQTTIDSDLDIETWDWDNTLTILNAREGQIRVDMGDTSSTINVGTVESSDITGVRVERAELSGTGDMEYYEDGGEYALMLYGVTPDNDSVAGLEGSWFVSGDFWGTGDHMTFWGESSGRVCWNGHCTDF